MSQKTLTKPAKWNTKGQLTNVLVVSLVLLVVALLYKNSDQRYHDFVSSQQALMDKSAMDTVQTLSIYIEQTRRIVALFANAESELISQLSKKPGDERTLNELRRRIEQNIPDYFSFTVASNEGKPFLDDFAGEIGEVCLLDIKRFVEMEHFSELFIHPNPLQYHFDIMAAVKFEGNNSGVFFVSFTPDVLSRLLANSEIGSHQMMLLHQDRHDLIEITSQGSREILQRDINLNEAEYDTISVLYDVPGSVWTLVYLPDNDLFLSMKKHYRVQALEVFIVVFTLSMVMIVLIKREEKKRYTAELALLDSHSQLETRVQLRTQELQKTNDKLQGEITERKRAEEELMVSQRRYALAAKGAHDGIWEWAADNDQIHFSSRWLEMTGTEIDADGKLNDWLAFLHENDRKLFATIFEQAKQGSVKEIDIEFRMQNKTGRMRWYRCHAATEKNTAGEVIHIAGSQADIHEQKLAEQQLQHNALHDLLTGLPNRHLFSDRLSQAINTRLCDRNYLYAVMFIDLDRFKQVNDSLGHSAGDILLKGVAERLSACIRPGDTLARIGGDEFIVLINNFKNIADVTSLAERMNVAVAGQFIIEGQELVVNASIGIALGAENHTDAAQLIRDADIAMYSAKDIGTGHYFIFNESIRQDTMARMKTETELRKSLGCDQLRIYYQPIVDLAQGNICGLEALLRWAHPERGIVQPDDFIPLAEETGLIVALGAWVMGNACLQMKDWQEEFPDYQAMSLSVNLSCKQFLQSNLTEKIKQILQETHINKSTVSLNLEITETVVMQNAPCSTGILQDLKTLGVKLAVDDFGTGYSSLAYLQHFPIDILKIDKQFVSMIDCDGDSRSIVNTVIDLAANLGLKVVAEGVETKAQFEILRDMGCHYAQGFYFSKPAPVAEIEKLLSARPNWS